MSANNKERRIAEARQLRRDDELDASQEILLSLLEAYPEDALVLYEVGGSYDVIGEEKKAIPYYRQALEAGLSGADLEECYICLGSCLRNTGRFVDAIKLLQSASEQFPENQSMRVFLALAYYNDSQDDEAVRLLLDVLLQTSSDESIRTYADVLDYYKDHLDEIWAED